MKRQKWPRLRAAGAIVAKLVPYRSSMSIIRNRDTGPGETYISYFGNDVFRLFFGMALNRSFYPTTSAVHPVSVVILDPTRDTKHVATYTL